MMSDTPQAISGANFFSVRYNRMDINSGKMKWLRFTWKLEASSFDTALPVGKYDVRTADRGERMQVERVINSSFSMDSEWARFGRHIQRLLDEALDRSFTPKHPECIVLVHGSRIIGASLLNPLPDQPSNLPSGPCVLIEYRSRGLGTLLLSKSLDNLASRGLLVANAITPVQSIAARYVYPKFGGSAEPYIITEDGENEE